MTPQQTEQQIRCREWYNFNAPNVDCTLYGKKDCPNICNYSIRMNGSEAPYTRRFINAKLE
jgi:hypothetical protein